ncbi:hypothetical protein LACWKB8_1640 [Lactobacillus sp. wkB8]|nr:hypothetical protein LACWKB8_1640 [Lactobacillus sp. wkB8]
MIDLGVLLLEDDFLFEQAVAPTANNSKKQVIRNFLILVICSFTP